MAIVGSEQFLQKGRVDPFRVVLDDHGRGQNVDADAPDTSRQSVLGSQQLPDFRTVGEGWVKDNPNPSGNMVFNGQIPPQGGQVG